MYKIETLGNKLEKKFEKKIVTLEKVKHYEMWLNPRAAEEYDLAVDPCVGVGHF